MIFSVRVICFVLKDYWAIHLDNSGGIQRSTIDLSTHIELLFLNKVASTYMSSTLPTTIKSHLTSSSVIRQMVDK